MEKRFIDTTSIGRTRSGTRSLGEFEIVVVFTDTRRTLKALKTAARLANGLGARIRLLVPHIVPFSVPMDARLVGITLGQRRFLATAAKGKVETLVDIRLCRNRWQMLQHVLSPESIIVLGTRHRYWPTLERRLARKLRSAGHQVVFSD